MTVFLAEFREEFRGTTPFIAWLFVSVLLAAGGPLGTLRFGGVEQRFLLWAGIVAAMMALTALLSLIVARFLRYDLRRRETALIAVAVACAVFAPLGTVAADCAQGLHGADPAWIKAGHTETLVFLYLTALGLGACRFISKNPALLAPVQGVALPTIVPMPALLPEVRVLPRILARLSPKLQGDLLALTVRDHYVVVKTRAGTDSLLMRFADAIAEAAPVAGVQIHRSHWVAWSAIDAVERDGAKVFVRIGETRFPVSRSYRPLLQARGLL